MATCDPRDRHDMQADAGTTTNELANRRHDTDVDRRAWERRWLPPQGNAHVDHSGPAGAAYAP